MATVAFSGFEPEDERRIGIFNPGRLSPIGPDPCERVEYIDVSRIVLNVGSQPRAAIDKDAVHDYAAAAQRGESLPPPRLVYDPLLDTYYCCDGFHRIMAYLRAKIQKIQVYVRDGTVKDAVLLSLTANTENGLRPTNDDKRRAVIRAFDFDEFKEWTDKSIADHLKVSASLVSTIRNELGLNPPGNPKRQRVAIQPDGSKKPVVVSPARRTPKPASQSDSKPADSEASAAPSPITKRPTAAQQRTAITPRVRLENLLRKEKADYQLDLNTPLGPIPAANHTRRLLYWPANTFKTSDFLEAVGRMLVLRERAGSYKNYDIVLIGEPDRETERHASILDEAGHIVFLRWPKD